MAEGLFPEDEGSFLGRPRQYDDNGDVGNYPDHFGLAGPSQDQNPISGFVDTLMGGLGSVFGRKTLEEYPQRVLGNPMLGMGGAMGAGMAISGPVIEGLSKSIVGAAPLAADQLLHTGLTEAAQQTSETPFDMPARSTELLQGAFSQIGKDQPAAYIPAAALVAGEFAAPGPGGKASRAARTVDEWINATANLLRSSGHSEDAAFGRAISEAISRFGSNSVDNLYRYGKDTVITDMSEASRALPRVNPSGVNDAAQVLRDQTGARQPDLEALRAQAKAEAPVEQGGFYDTPDFLKQDNPLVNVPKDEEQLAAQEGRITDKQQAFIDQQRKDIAARESGAQQGKVVDTPFGQQIYSDFDLKIRTHLPGPMQEIYDFGNFLAEKGADINKVFSEIERRYGKDALDSFNYSVRKLEGQMGGQLFNIAPPVAGAGLGSVANNDDVSDEDRQRNALIGGAAGLAVLALAKGKGGHFFPPEELEAAAKRAGFKSLQDAAEAIKSGKAGEGMPGQFLSAVIAAAKQKNPEEAEKAGQALVDILQESTDRAQGALSKLNGRNAPMKDAVIPDEGEAVEILGHQLRLTWKKNLGVPEGEGEFTQVGKNLPTPVEPADLPRKALGETYFPFEGNGDYRAAGQASMEANAAKDAQLTDSARAQSGFTPGDVGNNPPYGIEQGLFGGENGPQGRGLGGAALEFAGTLKTVKASGDISGSARQALPFILGHPIAWTKGMSNQFVSMFKDEKFFDTLLSKQVQDAYSLGLDDLYLGTRGGGVLKGEEAFQSNLFHEARQFLSEKQGPQWMPFKLLVGAADELLERSERGYLAMLNTVRLEAAKGVVNGYEAMGRPLSTAQKEDLAWVINHASGRGFKTPESDLLQSAAKIANVAFFSPQFRFSRLQFIKDVGTGYVEVMNSLVRGQRPDPVSLEKVRLGLGYVAGVSGLLYMLKQTYGADKLSWVDIDPNPLSDNFGFRIDLGHSDLGKVAIGKAGQLPGPIPSTVQGAALGGVGFGVQMNDRDHKVMVDVMAGEAQDIRTIARILHTVANTGQQIARGGKYEYSPDATLHSGKKIDFNREVPPFGDERLDEVIQGYVENSLSPAISLAMDYAHHPADAAKFSFENPFLGLLLPLGIGDGVSAGGLTLPSHPSLDHNDTPQPSTSGNAPKGSGWGIKDLVR